MPLPMSLTNTHGRRPSLNKFNNTLKQFAAGPANAKPSRGSDRIQAIDLVHDSFRSGPLGSGAIVVGTPSEALRDYKNGTRSGPQTVTPRSSQDEKHELISATFATPAGEEPPSSPPLPPLPLFEQEKPTRDYFGPATNKAAHHAHAARILANGSTSESQVSVTSPPVLLSVLHPCPPHAPFTPFLLSDPPVNVRSMSDLIVTLETGSAIHKTCLETLTARSSHLSGYLVSLFASGYADPHPAPESSPTVDDDDSASMYSKSSRCEERSGSSYATENRELPDGFRSPLLSQGLQLHTSRSPSRTSSNPSRKPINNIHVFLDRPSEPYTHILSYLRSPASYESLPRAVQLRQDFSNLDALLELRDEAAYLGLSSLTKLCNDELDSAEESVAQVSLGHRRSRSATVQLGEDPTVEIVNTAADERTAVNEDEDIETLENEIRLSLEGEHKGRRLERGPSLPSTPRSFLPNDRASRSSPNGRSPDSLIRRPAMMNRRQERSPPPGWI